MASSEETRLDIPPHGHEISEEEEKEEQEQEEKEEQEEEKEEAEAEADDGLIVEADMEVNKRMVEIFLLMATVIAGSCYAAMLTLSDNFGRLSDPTTLMYLLFVFSNLVAVFCAILTVVSIIWSYFLERRAAGRALENSAAFLAFALSSMSAAITFGAGVVVKKSMPIRIGVLMLGLFFGYMVNRFALPVLMNARWRQMIGLIMGGRAHDR